MEIDLTLHRLAFCGDRRNAQGCEGPSSGERPSKWHGAALLHLLSDHWRAHFAAPAEGGNPARTATLELILKIINDVERECDAIVKEAAAQHPNADKIKVLTVESDRARGHH
jgi:hypothetical protein